MTGGMDMAEHTKIQWCDHTFNPWIGCAKVNEGCRFCYAETLMDTRYGRVQWGPNGTRSRTKTWGQPLKWNREAIALGERRKVFCASLADVFEDFPGTVRGPDILGPWRSDLFKLIDQCQQLDWLLLTKRPENIRRMWEGPNRRNVWLGTSVANQRNLDEFLPRLLSARGLGPCLFLSIEPQIGRIDLSRFLFPCPVVDWVIQGGESKQGHGEPRPFDLSWARLTIQQCREARIPVFVKQLGSNAKNYLGRDYQTKDSHGGDWEEWPEDLRVRECPESYYAPMELQPCPT
jgi:protein gp37